MKRRVFLLTLIATPVAALVAACGDRLESTITVGDATSTPETPVPTATPSASGTPPPLAPLTAAFESSDLGQGETALITARQEGAHSISVRFADQHYPLLEDGEQFWGVLGVGLLAPLGPGVATVTSRDASMREQSIEVPYTVVPVQRPIDYLTTTPEVAAVLTVEAAERESYLRTFEQFNRFQGGAGWDGRILQPTEGIMTTQFGQARSINGGPVGGHHSGTDLANKEGTPIHAAARGRVAWVGPMPIRGNSVLLDHGAGVVTGYHHLLETEVEVGQYVEAGDEIAKMGSTGFSTGPHLHWEMTIYGVNVDPMTWTTRAFTPGGADAAPTPARPSPAASSSPSPTTTATTTPTSTSTAARTPSP